MGMTNVPAAPRYKVFQVTDDGAVIAGNVTLMAAYISGINANASCVLHDSDAADNQVIELHAPSGGSAFEDFTDLGGIAFGTGIFADIEGVGANVLLWVNG